MPIDPSKVKWDTSNEVIDPSKVKWDTSQMRGTAAPVSNEIPGPRRNYSLVEVPIEAVKNIPESTGKFISGIANAVIHPIDTIMGVSDLAAGALHNVLPKSVTDFIDKFDISPEATRRAVATANAVGGIYKDRYGTYESIKRTLAEDPVGAASDLSTLLGVGGTVANKLGIVDAGATLAKAGATINPMRPIAPVIEYPFKIAGKGANAIYNAIDPKSTAYIKAVEGHGQDVLNALRQPSEIVSGSLPTAAEAASSVGATRFSAMGESARKTLPTSYYERAEKNKAVQLAAIRELSKTPEEIKIAEATRAATAKTNYAAAEQQIVKADPALAQLAADPFFKDALPNALKVSESQGITFKTNPIKFLHNVKISLDKMLTRTGDTSLDSVSAAQVQNVRNSLVDWMEAKTPAYKTARETFAAQSEPINQMQVGQFLEGKLKPALGEETAKLRAAGYAGALENAPTTIKRATGQSRFENLSDILTPDQIKIVEGVRADLARARQTEAQAAAARGIGPNVDLAGTEVIGNIRAPNLINRITTVANDLIKRLQGQLDHKLAIELATEMLDPSTAAKALQKALDRQAKGEKLANFPKKTGNVVSAAMRKPGVVNTLSVLPTNEVQNSLSMEQ